MMCMLVLYNPKSKTSTSLLKEGRNQEENSKIEVKKEYFFFVYLLILEKENALGSE